MKRLPRKRWKQLVRQWNKGCEAMSAMNEILEKHCNPYGLDDFRELHDDYILWGVEWETELDTLIDEIGPMPLDGVDLEELSEDKGETR